MDPGILLLLKMVATREGRGNPNLVCGAMFINQILKSIWEDNNKAVFKEIHICISPKVLEKMRELFQDLIRIFIKVVQEVLLLSFLGTTIRFCSLWNQWEKIRNDVETLS